MIGARAGSPPGTGAAGRRTRAGAFWVVLADNLGWAVIVPVLPYYAERLGAGPAGVGLLLGAYAAAQALAAPPTAGGASPSCWRAWRDPA